MAPRTVLTIRPALMRWARESVGASLAEAAEQLGVAEATINTWETEGASVSPAKLDKMARFYKRPSAAFFLPSPPTEPPGPVDFRLFNAPTSRKLGRDALLALRRARWLQGVYNEIHEDRLPSRLSLLRTSFDEDIVTLTERARETIGITMDKQKGWPNDGRAFKLWREAFEEHGIPVFVFNVGKAFRGCSLGGERPAIVIGSSDYSWTGRIFTLFHEWCHLMLDNPGICEPDAAVRAPSNAKVEAFCNSFAGEFLVPRVSLLGERAVGRLRSGDLGLENAVSRLATLYSVSRAVTLIRLRRERLVSEESFDRLMRVYSAPIALREDVKMKGRTRAERAVVELGVSFVGDVLGAAERGEISYRDVTSYLSVGVGDIDKIPEHMSIL